MKITVLIIEDHPAMVLAYRNILLEIQNIEFEFFVASNCDSALDTINSSKHIDIILLDIQIPPSINNRANSGEDLLFAIKKIRPFARTLVLTSHIETVFLYNLVKTMNPCGILVKSDFGGEDLKTAVTKVLEGEQAIYSTAVQRAIERLSKKDLYLDNYNRQILMLMGKGIKTKSLPMHLSLSLSAVDKRKLQLREYFKIKNGSDEEILLAARKLGYI
ncbi:MAG: response regulator transcription factor [Sphingobacteriales bacterium]|nr:MAG: response regulator transcription factor [Sphingobacteriales bacterium]